jgi:hypothetical protein
MEGLRRSMSLSHLHQPVIFMLYRASVVGDISFGLFKVTSSSFITSYKTLLEEMCLCAFWFYSIQLRLLGGR